MKKGWEYKALGEVCEVINGLWKGKKEPFINVGVIRNANFTKDFTLRYDNIEWLDVEERQYSKRKLQLGDLIVEKSGGSEKQPVGRTVLFDKSEGEYSFSNFTSVLRIKGETIESKLLFYYLFYIYHRGDTKSMQKATTGIHNIEMDKYLSITIPVPPLSEQEEIVSRLDKAFEQIENMRRNAEQSLTTAQQLFQSTLSHLLTPQPHWERKTLGEISKDMYRGAGIKRDEITNNGTPCLRYGEIYTTYNYSFDKCISHTDINKIKSQKYFEHGDLLFAITGESVEDIGKTIAYTGHEKCLLGGDIACMKHSQNPQYLAYALSTADAIRQKGKGKVKLKVVHTSIPAIKEIEIPIPPLSEQATIVAKLDSLSAKVKQLKDNHTRTVALCDEMKQALLKEVFED